MYDYLIIGKGLFGSAAARYISQTAASVCLVGPDEPADWTTHRGVFASHYDEARIASISAPDEAWAALDRLAMAEYRALEAASGISFYAAPGRLSVTPADQEFAYPYLTEGDTFQSYDPTNLPANLPFRFPADYTVRYEAAPSGYINPRAMVQAQVAVAQQQGVEIVRQVAVQVQDVGTHVAVGLDNGEVLSAKKVLLATGAFTHCFDLLPRPVDLLAESITTVLAEVPAEFAARYPDLPPLNYLATNSPLIDISLLPPLPYPNGRIYLKLVVYAEYDKQLPDLAAIHAWFQNPPDFPYLAEVQALLSEIMPDLPVLSWQIKPCLDCYTLSTKPIIDTLIPGRIYLAVGGNGGAAHPSDAIGQLAAGLMLHDAWLADMAHGPFQL